MGEALTEAGAISALAAFFRQNMDACAWTEETTTPPYSTSAPPGAPPLLRFPLRSTHTNQPFRGVSRGSSGDSDSTRPAASSPGDRGRPPYSLHLVVSRGPGPDFSQQEARVASHAAVLLSQALASVRDRAALSDANDALEKSFRGMEEASQAVAVLVEERDQRARHEEARRTDLRELHEGAMSAAAGELEMARRAAEELQLQLSELHEAIAVVAGAAEDVCREVAAAADAPEAGDLAARGEGEGSVAGAGVGEVIAVIEGAARRALRCSYARVAPAEIEPRGGAVKHRRRVWTESEALRGRHRREGFSEARVPKDLNEDAKGEDESQDDGASSEGAPLRVPIPQVGDGSASIQPLTLSVHGAAATKPFTDDDRRVASALAACLGTGLQALRERQRALKLERAEAAHTADAEVEARERGDRAVAGMRALVTAAQA